MNRIKVLSYGAEWWDKLSIEEQKQYFKEHPKSKNKVKTGPVNKTGVSTTKPTPKNPSWRDWNLQEVKHLNIRPPKGVSDEEYVQIIKSAPIFKVPKAYFRDSEKEGIYEPYSKADIKGGLKEGINTRRKSILKSWQKGDAMPYVLAEEAKNKWKFEIVDGWTRSAIAEGLGIPIEAKLLSDALFRDWIKKNRKSKG